MPLLLSSYLLCLLYYSNYSTTRHRLRIVCAIGKKEEEENNPFLSRPNPRQREEVIALAERN